MAPGINIISIDSPSGIAKLFAYVALLVGMLVFINSFPVAEPVDSSEKSIKGDHLEGIAAASQCIDALCEIQEFAETSKIPKVTKE